MFDILWPAIRFDPVDEMVPGTVEFLQHGSLDSHFAVSEFAQASIAVAVSEIQALRSALWGVTGVASVDRVLASHWCMNSVYPQGWESPAQWDEFTGDYPSRDGWIRLHTNAPHHRRVALSVLGNPSCKSDAAIRVGKWNGVELETAVVNAGGAAAVMMSESEWSQHPQGRAVTAEPVVAWQAFNMTANAADSKESMMRGTPARPLHGVRVLDLTRVLAGPVCTRFLASMGADVLRIDPPDWEEDGNALEMTIGKRCAGLDLRQTQDQKKFSTLVRSAHVLVHGYRRDALSGLGFGSDTLRELNPALIDIALNAYGWSGPWTKRRGFDSLVQMSSGIAEKGQDMANARYPVPLPFQALDHASGYLLAAATVHAIMQRKCHGRILQARLSLARQASLLQELSSPPVDGPQAQLTDAQFTEGIESTPWGPVKRLRQPYEIEGVDAGWRTPVSRLRSASASWSSL